MNQAGAWREFIYIIVLRPASSARKWVLDDPYILNIIGLASIVKRILVNYLHVDY